MKLVKRLVNTINSEGFSLLASLSFIALGISFLYSVSTSAQMVEDLNPAGNKTNSNLVTPINNTSQPNVSATKVIVPLY
jgi:hypothetical protein